MVAKPLCPLYKNFTNVFRQSSLSRTEVMIRVDAGNRLLKKEKSGYSHKGNNHLFLYYSCSYTLTSTSPFLFSRFHRYTSRCSSPWLEQLSAGHVTFTEVKEILKSQIATSKHNYYRYSNFTRRKRF